MYENIPQWRHSFFDKCEFWERRLNLLVSQIFYCDILKPLALVLLWKMQDVWVLQSVFFLFWSRDLRHMVWLIITRMAPLLTRMACMLTRMTRTLTRMTHWLAGSHIIHTPEGTYC